MFNCSLQDNHVEKTKKITYIWKISLSCQFQSLKINYNVILFNFQKLPHNLEKQHQSWQKKILKIDYLHLFVLKILKMLKLLVKKWTIWTFLIVVLEFMLTFAWKNLKDKLSLKKSLIVKMKPIFSLKIWKNQ